MINILVVENDVKLNQIVCNYLNDSGFQAKDDLPSKQKGVQLGIDDYMVKPIELDELLLRVRALVKRVLELMNGDIQITSEEGKGSTFTVTLPMAGMHENREVHVHGS